MTPEQLAKSGSEHAHQRALFAWANSQLEIYPELRWMLAVPNGGKRDPITAARLKAEGVKAGVPDICFPIPRHNVAGLWIEMKRVRTETKTKGRVADKQSEWIEMLRDNGYGALACYGWTEARDVLLAYLAPAAAGRATGPNGL